MEALGHIVRDVHMHEHKAFNMWVEPGEGGEAGKSSCQAPAGAGWGAG